jgi:hypothetical protein
VPTTGWEEVTADWRRPPLAGRSRVGQLDDNATDGGGGGVGTATTMGFTRKKDHRKKTQVGPTFDFFRSQILGTIEEDLLFSSQNLFRSWETWTF